MAMTMRTRPSLMTRSACARPAVITRRPAVAVRADWVSEAFTRVFTPNKNDMPAVTNEYRGTPSRGRNSSKPFKDGYSAGKQRTNQAASSVPQPATPAADQLAQSPAGPLQYVAAAVRRVMSNNFTSDEKETSTGAAGWKGNIRHRGRGNKGAHSNTY